MKLQLKVQKRELSCVTQLAGFFHTFPKRGVQHFYFAYVRESARGIDAQGNRAPSWVIGPRSPDRTGRQKPGP